MIYWSKDKKSFVRFGRVKFANKNNLFIIYVLYNQINMKKIMILMIVLISISGYTAADNDCGMVSFRTNWNFVWLDTWEAGGSRNILMPKAAIEKAMLNLKSFCCEKWFIKDGVCDTDGEINKKGEYPSSAYLYDHVLDVSMRRLDAKQKNKNWEDLIYGLTPDAAGLEWRKFISEHGNNKNGSIPLAISEKFKNTREAKWNILDAWSPNDKDLPWNQNLFEDYDNRKLVEKYLWVCETSIYLYLEFPVKQDKARLNEAYLSCKQLVHNRIKREISYTKAVLLQKGNVFLYNNIQAYLDTFFAQNKLIALWQLIFNIKNTFNEINKAVPELVPNCS